MGQVTKDNKIKVIIIDNDPTYLKMWEKIFNHLPDCSYIITNDPKSAISVIKAERIDLVISEIVLPTSDGYEIARLAYKYNPQVEVLLTTAYDCDLTRFNLKNPHFNILYKPYNDINDIQRFISRLVHHEDIFSDVSEDSFSENESFPEVMEWKL